MAMTAAVRTIQAIPEAVDVPMMARIHLGCREVMTMAAATPGLQIVSDRCTLWLTKDGELDDVILRPGERYTVADRKRVVLQGMR